MDLDIAPLSATVIDLLILGCLVVAIIVGTTLLWQIMVLRRERFRFDQMTQALSAQLAIFQSAMAKGREDIEVKITRFDRLLDQARRVADELHILIEAGENAKVNAPPPASKKTMVAHDPLPDRPLFAIVDPEFSPEVKEDRHPAVDDFADLTVTDRAELSQLATPAEKALMAALKRAGRR